MDSPDVATAPEAGPVAPSPPRARIIAAALDLFAEHGVGGTSLQMIADHIGVTKAAVYHQYNTKDEIVLAAAEAELARLEAVVAAAETERSRKRARDVLLTGMIDLAVDRRRTVSTILNDPVIGRFFAEHETFRDILRRQRRILVGDDAGPEERVRIAMLIASTSGAVIHPFVAGIDDDTLRPQLLVLARRFLGLRA